MRSSGALLGAELELDVLRPAHGGVFVAQHDGRVVFVPDVLPGERALVRVTEDRHEGFLRAEALAVADASPHRRPHVWAAASLDRDPAERAGGAEFGHIDPAEQRRLKEAVLVDALVRIGRLAPEDVAGLDTAVRAVDGSERGTGWRTRVRLHVGARGEVGPYAARSRTVVPAEDLPLALPRVAAVAPHRSERRPGAAIDIVGPADAPAFVVECDSTAVVEHAAGRTFRLEAAGFWQVHPSAADVLSAAVERAIDPALVDPAAESLDLYGGVGLFAAAIARVGGTAMRIATVESDVRASAHAAANLRDLANVRAVAQPAERFVAAAEGRRGTIVLDPPRSGAGVAVVDAIVALEPAQVVYVACDPVALARDAGRFAQHGWGLAGLEAFDLFPNTHHLEAVAAFRR